LFIFWSILVGLLGLCMLIWFTTMRVDLLFTRVGGNHHAEIKFATLGGIVHYRMKWDGGVTEETKQEDDRGVTSADEKRENFATMYQRLRCQLPFLQATLCWMLRKVTCEELRWGTTVGTGDAAETGVLTGLIWTIKSILLGLAAGYIRWDQSPQLEVAPQFNRAILEIQFHSIIRFRLGHAILAITRLLTHMRKGRGRKWQIIPFKV
jgi:hypothetical protein